MNRILSDFQNKLNSLLNSPVITPQLCGLLAKLTGLKQHNDSVLNAYVLVVALIEVFLGSGPHQGFPNSFRLDDIYQSYNATAQRFNTKREGSHKGKIKLLTKDGLMYHLKKPAFEEFAKRLFEKVFSHTKDYLSQSKILDEATLLIQSLGVLLPTPVTDVVVNDGCYKVVHGAHEDEFKGARTAKKGILKEDGSIQKSTNAQLGIQTSYSLTNFCSTNIEISSGVANEREFVDVKCGELHILDAGYYSFKLFDDFDKANAFLVMRGKSNIVGNLQKVVIDGVDCSSQFSIGLSLNFNMPLLPSLDKLVDMELSVTYKQNTATRRIRVIRFEDNKTKGKPAFIVTNLPWSVPTETVLNIMRLRWQIELYFKELKSFTRYRAALTNSKSLTVGLVYFSMLTHLSRSCFLQTVERYTDTPISLQKVESTLISVNGVTASLSVMAGRLMLGHHWGYINDSFAQVKTSVFRFLIESLNRLKPSVQSAKNKFRTIDAKIAFIAQQAIEVNPFGRDTAKIQSLLHKFVQSRGIHKLLKHP